MKHYSILKATALAIMTGAIMAASCTTQEEPVAKAVLGDVSIINFPARNPEPQLVTVYSDGEWHTKAPSWITVDPETGNGVTSVTITASENVDEVGLLEPRKDTVIIGGNKLSSRLLIFVSQEGDTYRFAEHLTLDKVAALADGKAFYLDEATVSAVTKSGFMLSGDGALVYSQTKADVKVGDKVSLKGIKGTDNSLPVITLAEDVTVKSSGTFSYPAVQSFNDMVPDYAASAYDFVKVSGSVNAGNLQFKVGDVTYAVKQIDAPDALSIASLNGNNVDLTGYVAGVLGSNLYGLITTKLEDKGAAVVTRPEKLLYCKWRFTTSKLTEYAEHFGGTAGVTDQTEGFSDLYVPSNVAGNGKITYYQVDKTGYTPTSGNPKRIIGATGHPYVTGAWPGDYWLYTGTDNYTYPKGTNLHIKFLTRVSKTGHKYWMLEYFDGNEWKPADEYPVSTETETGTNAKYNFIENTSNVAVECAWTLAAPCREPKFRMRCVANWQFQGEALANPNGGTCRFADNDDDGEDAGPVFEVTSAPED